MGNNEDKNNKTKTNSSMKHCHCIFRNTYTKMVEAAVKLLNALFCFCYFFCFCFCFFEPCDYMLSISLTNNALKVHSRVFYCCHFIYVFMCCAYVLYPIVNVWNAKNFNVIFDKLEWRLVSIYITILNKFK